MATVAVRAKDETPDCATTVVTAENFTRWKRQRGRHVAFVVQMPASDTDDDGGILVCTLSEMRGLPAGNYQAQLVQKCAIPDEAKKELRGSDLWKCI